MQSSRWPNRRNQEKTQHDSEDRESEGSVRSERSDQKNDVYVGNIPASFDETDLLEQFRGYRVISVRNFTKESKKVFAFLKCVDQDEVVRIVKEMNSHQVDGRALKVRAMDKDLQYNIDSVPLTGDDEQRDNIRHRSFKSRDSPLPLMRSNYDATTATVGKPRPQMRGNPQPQDSNMHSKRDCPPPLEVDDSHPPPLELAPRRIPPPHLQPTAVATMEHNHASTPYRPEQEGYRRPRMAPAGYAKSSAAPVTAHLRPTPANNYHKSPAPTVDGFHRPEPADLYCRSEATSGNAHRRPLSNKYIQYRVPPNSGYTEPARYSDTEFDDSRHTRSAYRDYSNKPNRVGHPPNSGYVEPARYMYSSTEFDDSRHTRSDYRHYSNKPNRVGHPANCGYPEPARYSDTEFDDSRHIRSAYRDYSKKPNLAPGPYKPKSPILDTSVRVSPVPQNIYISTSMEDEPEPDEKVVVCVANFPYRTSEDDLFALFEDFSPVDVDIVQNSPTEEEDGFTYALVTLPNMELAEAAIFELDNTTFRRRSIILQILCGDDISFEGNEETISPTTGLTRTTTPKKYSPVERQTLCERFSHLKMASGARLFH